MDWFQPKCIISAMTDSDIVKFPLFLDGDVPRSASYGVYISQLIRFARLSRHVTVFSARIKIDPFHIVCAHAYVGHGGLRQSSEFFSSNDRWEVRTTHWTER